MVLHFYNKRKISLALSFRVGFRKTIIKSDTVYGVIFNRTKGHKCPANLSQSVILALLFDKLRKQDEVINKTQLPI